MQILFDESEEFGRVPGLGILPGKIVRFAVDPAGKRKVPHMGWNALTIVRRAPHLAGVQDGAYVYFVHSYYPVPADPGDHRDDDRLRRRVRVVGLARQRLRAPSSTPRRARRSGSASSRNFAALAGETDAVAAAR